MVADLLVILRWIILHLEMKEGQGNFLRASERTISRGLRNVASKLGRRSSERSRFKCLHVMSAYCRVITIKLAVRYERGGGGGGVDFSCDSKIKDPRKISQFLPGTRIRVFPYPAILNHH